MDLLLTQESMMDPAILHMTTGEYASGSSTTTAAAISSSSAGVSLFLGNFMLAGMKDPGKVKVKGKGIAKEMKKESSSKGAVSGSDGKSSDHIKKEKMMKKGRRNETIRNMVGGGPSRKIMSRDVSDDDYGDDKDGEHGRSSATGTASASMMTRRRKRTEERILGVEMDVDVSVKYQEDESELDDDGDVEDDDSSELNYKYEHHVENMEDDQDGSEDDSDSEFASESDESGPSGSSGNQRASEPEPEACQRDLQFITTVRALQTIVDRRLYRVRTGTLKEYFKVIL
jgi:hypothetical protein